MSPSRPGHTRSLWPRVQASVPAVTMMDYEHQPANHLSFRLARRVIVPSVFPDDPLRRFGASSTNVVRYDGFREELYLADFWPDPSVLDELALNPDNVITVFWALPDGALCHRMEHERFDVRSGVPRFEEKEMNGEGPAPERREAILNRVLRPLQESL
jgi:predicted glycosyltransferase